MALIALAADVPVLGALKDLIVEHVPLLDSVERLTDDANLAALGLDSMSALNLLLDIEEQFQVQFPDDYLTEEVFRTPATLEAAISRLLMA